jgi:hypothetical protein
MKSCKNLKGGLQDVADDLKVCVDDLDLFDFWNSQILVST